MFSIINVPLVVSTVEPFLYTCRPQCAKRKHFDIEQEVVNGSHSYCIVYCNEANTNGFDPFGLFVLLPAEDEPIDELVDKAPLLPLLVLLL